ncbi:MAG: ATP-binding protein [Candidatus Aramenus sp.]|jgi:AAA+ ATPase superfamily predicted ATPase|nr:ATP-binding protein [Candidatus Aramenus sp.]
MRLYLRRKDEEKIRKIKNWTLIYGRRKTGKSTLVKNNLRSDYYVLIADSNNAILDDKIISIEDAMKEVKQTLYKEGIVVIDEFQRLPQVYWSMIGGWSPHGILVAIGSSYGIVNRVFDRNSPLLGLFTPMEIDIIPYEEVLVQLRDPILSVIFRDPWIIPFIDSYKEFVDRIKEFSLISKGLIGEVFKEEERELTEIYYKTLLLLGEGIWKPSEISGIIQPKGGEPTISSMINKLAKMGLVEKIPTLSKGNYYKIKSPPLSLSFYAESKYAISERDITISELPIGREVQFSVGSLLAKYFGGLQYYSPKEDIDVIIMKKRKPIWAFEVKMGEITRSEAKEAIKKMSKVAEKVGLVSLKEKPEELGDLSIGPNELLRMAKELVSKEGT